MASPELIDLESLLQPISDDTPTGNDVREDSSPTSAYQTIKAARNQARAAERQSVVDGNDSDALEFWRQIETLAPQIIKEQSKDLEVASWYIEAMVRRRGFGGLRDAFKLTLGLVENFWDNLHPMPDEYGMETRVSCLAGLNGEGAEGVLIAPVRKVEITEGDFPGPFSLWQYLQASDINKMADDSAKKSKIEAMGYSLEDVEKAVEASSEQFYVDLRDDISTCIETYKKLGQALDEKCGLQDAPSIRNITDVLDECLGAVNHVAKLKFPVAGEDGESAAEDGEAETGSSGNDGQVVQKVVAKGPIASREDAFKQLLEIAAYFKKTEPHSPVSYVLQKAVKWGGMSLGELISELIPDQSSREHFTELTGVESPAED
ncbi:hypothetical protein TDB9533_03515 [Thalassocella blandensis]|nr:hypothetical protein TDB9533_03515 [Thalassocella blandensis]